MPSPPLFPKYMLFFFGKAIYSEIWVCLNHAYTLKIDGHQFLCFQFIFQMLQNPVMFPVNRRILISTRMNGTNNSLSVINRVELLLLKGQHLSNTTPSHIVAAFFPRVHLATRKVPQYGPWHARCLALVQNCSWIYRKGGLSTEKELF